MAQRNFYVTFMQAFTIAVTLFFLLIMLNTSLPMATILGATAAWSAFSALLAYASYMIVERRQARAFDGKKQVSASTDAHQQRTIEIDLPLAEAFDIALPALQALDAQDVPVRNYGILQNQQFVNIYETDRQMGVIKAGLRAQTLGIRDVIDFSRIEINLQRVDANTTTLRIDSRPNFIGEEYDLGKNLHYVNQLAGYIRRESAERNAESRLTAQNSDDDTHNTDDDRLSDSSHR